MPHPSQTAAKPNAGMAADMAAKCQAMTADHEKMMAEMKAADQQLDDLAATRRFAPWGSLS